MLKHEIVYKDFNGDEQKEILWFHISKASVLMADNDEYGKIMELGRTLQEQAAGVDAAVELIDSDDPFDENSVIVASAVRTMAQLFDTIVDMGYGVRTDDGKNFIRNEKVLSDFKSSQAYDAFIEYFLSDPNKMLLFIEELMKPQP